MLTDHACQCMGYGEGWDWKHAYKRDLSTWDDWVGVGNAMDGGVKSLSLKPLQHFVGV